MERRFRRGLPLGVDLATDAPLTLALVGAAGVLNSGRRRDYLIAGAGLGLACATKYTAGAGYATVAAGASGCDANNAAQGCSEYETGLGTATTTPVTLSASTAWAEAAMH